MNIPLDRLYHYIESVAREVRGDDVLIYHFYPHGSKNIDDLHCTVPHTIKENINYPHIICYDQEPLNYKLYQNTPVRLGKDFKFAVDPAQLPKRNIRVKTGNIYDKCVLLHSEQNSYNVELYQQDQFVPVYYWSHAIIARDWFRYAPYVNFDKNIKKTFLIYNRAWAGTREYRLKFSDLLVENNLLEHCKTNFNPQDHGYYKEYIFNNPIWKPIHNLEEYIGPTTASSCYSADFDIDDYNSTEFEVVLETLFDDQRQHLTEKILRPIACRQPFIVASTPGVLEYLKNYGFRTFDGIINEEYDTIQDPFSRMKSIIATMTEITTWSPEYKSKQMKKINEITMFNQAHFFSNQFFNQVITELKANLKLAFEHIETTNTGSHFLDLKLKNVPGMREYRKIPSIKHHRLLALKILREHRKNRKIVK